MQHLTRPELSKRSFGRKATRSLGPGPQRRKCPELGPWTLLLVVFVWADPAQALDSGLRVSTQGFLSRVPDEVLVSRLRTATLSSASASQQLSLQLHGLGHIAGRPRPELELRLGLDTGLVELLAEEEGPTRVLVDGRAFESAFPETLFLGETFIEGELGRNGVLELRAGKLRPRLGGGALFDAYGLGVYADLDLNLIRRTLPLSFRIWAMIPDATFTSQSKRSPFVDLEAALQLGIGGELRMLTAFAWDGDDGAAPVLQDALTRGALERLAETRDDVAMNRPAVERAFERLAARIEAQAAVGSPYVLNTEGWLGWSGAVLSFQNERLDVELVGLVGFGQLDVEIDPITVAEVFRTELGTLGNRALDEQRAEGPVSLLSGFGQATIRFSIFEEVALDAFILAMSGDGGLRPGANARSSYSSFVSLAPLLTHTSLFFNGGVGTSLASPTLASPAPDGAGLLSSGLFVDAFPNEWLHVRSGLAIMASTEPSLATGGRLYGLEGNMIVDMLFAERFLALLDVAVLAPLDYYGSLEAGVQAILGITVLWGDP